LEPRRNGYTLSTQDVAGRDAVFTSISAAPVRPFSFQESIMKTAITLIAIFLSGTVGVGALGVKAGFDKMQKGHHAAIEQAVNDAVN
jgi:hypothetical protein